MSLLDLFPNIESMKQLQYKIQIQAPAQKVYDCMLGLSNKSCYEQWTAAFNPTSTYEGNWEKGSKMLFLGTDEKGNKGGMVSEIAEHLPGQFVSIRHYGLYHSGQEQTEGPEVEKWANGFENYHFMETEGGTELKVDLDTAEDFVDYMNEHYPAALEKLKAMCEGQ